MCTHTNLWLVLHTFSKFLKETSKAEPLDYVIFTLCKKMALLKCNN